MLVNIDKAAQQKAVQNRRPVPPIVDAVARAICKSRSCNGFECCENPGSMGNKHKCPVDRGGFDDAATDALIALDAHGNFDNWIKASKDAIAQKAGALSDLYDAMPTEQFQQAFK